MKKCLTGKDYFGRDGVTAENCYSLANQPRKNVGFFMSTRLGVGCPLNKALPNKTGWKAIQFSAPSAFSIGEKANQYQSSEKGDSLMTTSINTPVIYQFNNHEVRTVIIDAEPWFCLKDVCDILGIKQAADLKRRLNPKGVAKNHTLTAGGRQQLIYINEGNLYKAIFQSEKPEAIEFENYVTGEVLPSIRKTGSYSVSQQPQLDALSTKQDREPLTNLVNTLVSAAPLSYRDVWHLVKAELKTAKAASEFTVSEVYHALKFVQSKIDQYTTRIIPRENDVHVGIITDMAMQGALRFSLVVSIGENVTKDTKLVMRQFLAHIDLTEQTAVKPYGATFSLAKR